ncbi:MAG TPA: cytochrome c [Alphaproteobacteria bacterium]|nr:cytochrome c [Alphaproteobacteria bacterium]
MTRTMRLSALAAALLAFAAALPALAGEEQVKLKPGPGVDAVERNCIGCHSLDYPVMNSPFLDHKGWDGEVAKMMKAYGAPVNPADVPAIVEYLTANYGTK